MNSSLSVDLTHLISLCKRDDGDAINEFCIGCALSQHQQIGILNINLCSYTLVF